MSNLVTVFERGDEPMERNRQYLYAGLVAMIVFAGVMSYRALRYQAFFADLSGSIDEVLYSHGRTSGIVVRPTSASRYDRIRLMMNDDSIVRSRNGEPPQLAVGQKVSVWYAFSRYDMVLTSNPPQLKKDATMVIFESD
jgi:hypothetical protein